MEEIIILDDDMMVTSEESVTNNITNEIVIFNENYSGGQMSFLNEIRRLGDWKFNYIVSLAQDMNLYRIQNNMSQKTLCDAVKLGFNRYKRALRLENLSSLSSNFSMYIEQLINSSYLQKNLLKITTGYIAPVEIEVSNAEGINFNILFWFWFLIL